jgi:hypothetical protein
MGGAPADQPVVFAVRRTLESAGVEFLNTPTILAWDFLTACRILRLEASTP